MKKPYSLLVLVAFFGFGGCHPIHVKADYDKSADFSRYQTFSFSPMRAADNTTVAFSVTNQESINHAITRELESRHYRLVEGDSDLKISNYLTVDDKQKVVGVGYTGYYNNDYYGYSGGRSDIVEYLVGTLVIDLVDMKDNRLIWQGTATGTAMEKLADPRAKINEAVEKVFRKYPVKKTTKD